MPTPSSPLAHSADCACQAFGEAKQTETTSPPQPGSSASLFLLK
jgi:hypothetical protein